MVSGRMIDAGGASALGHAAKRLFRRGQRDILLLPMGDGGLVTPVRELAHGAKMRALRAVGTHGGFTGPGGDSPEGVSGIDH